VRVRGGCLREVQETKFSRSALFLFPPSRSTAATSSFGDGVAVAGVVNACAVGFSVGFGIWLRGEKGGKRFSEREARFVTWEGR